METKFKPYKLEDSLDRLDNILESSSNFDDKDDIPKRDTLTYTNGYYVRCCALFVDLRDSSNLPNVHQKKVLAKIYRSYISEIVAILNGLAECKEINIVGDCVSAIFSGHYTSQVDVAFEAAAEIRSIVDILNYKLEKKGYSPIKAGIGLSWGRVLMIQAGYSGSGLNDVVYMGDAVNKASKMCSKAMKDVLEPIVATPDFVNSLKNKQYKDMFSPDLFKTYYSSKAYNIEMNNWLIKQREKDADKKRRQQNPFSNW